MKRSLPAVLGVVVATTTVLASNTEGIAAATAHKTTATRFAMNAFGFASRYSGGSAPSESDPTAYDILGCTNRAGISHSNTEASSSPQDSVSTHGARTEVWTVKHSAKVSSWARNTIDNVSFGLSSGVLKANNVVTVAHAYYTGTKFVQHSWSHVGSISFAGTSQPVPTPGNPLVIPGVATLTAGTNAGTTRSHAATADRTALRIHFDSSGATHILGKAHRTIAGGAPLGVFRGQAYAKRSTDAQNNTTSGRTPLLVMPCQGTGGDIKTRTAHNLTGSDTNVGSASTSERANQAGSRMYMWTQARVSQATFGVTGLSARNIVARASVSFNKGDKTIHRSSEGTSEGAVYLNGTQRDVPKSGTLTIPNVAKIETNIVQRTRSGLRVIAMKVTMLDGSGFISYLGYASAGLTPSAAR
jgi:hypothetical protein